jgi:hypothetical protein
MKLNASDAKASRKLKSYVKKSTEAAFRKVSHVYDFIYYTCFHSTLIWVDNTTWSYISILIFFSYYFIDLDKVTMLMLPGSK